VVTTMVSLLAFCSRLPTDNSAPKKQGMLISFMILLQCKVQQLDFVIAAALFWQSTCIRAITAEQQEFLGKELLDILTQGECYLAE